MPDTEDTAKPISPLQMFGRGESPVNITKDLRARPMPISKLWKEPTDAELAALQREIDNGQMSLAFDDASTAAGEAAGAAGEATDQAGQGNASAPSLP